jgi:arsenate reductase
MTANMTAGKTFKVMFLCTGNSCRSQMAEGFARELGKGVIAPCSAGLMPCYVHPTAIKVMKETGIDISYQHSKAIDEGLLKKMDIIITLCVHADAACPATPPEIKRINMPVHDPVSTIGTDEEILDAFRKARDEIKTKIQSLIEDLRIKV